MTDSTLPTDPALWPATAMVTAYRAGTLSPVEVVAACLRAVERDNGRLNAFNAVDADGACAAARKSEARWAAGRPIGPADGVPASVKDIVLAKGWPTLRGSRTTDPLQTWDEDSPVVAGLRDAGCILIGRTTTPEFGWKGVTDSPLTGITRNPWDDSKTPGGSSGGAAVAAACGMAALNVGTDGGGSVRIPAAFTGIFGLKPSFARIPVHPPSVFGSISHVGPMTRTVADAALMMQITARSDDRDWTRPPFPELDFTAALDRPMAKSRIGVVKTFNGHHVDPEIAALFDDAVEVFADLGADLRPVTLPFEGIEEIFRIHWHGAAAVAVGNIPEARRNLIDPGLRAIAEDGDRITKAEYIAAMNERARIGAAVNKLYRDIDLLLMPTIPIPAFEAGHDVPPDSAFGGWPDWTPFTPPFNLTQQPAATVPCGLTASGLPAGLQIVGPMHDDAAVMAASHAFEQARPFALPPRVTGR
ncbi:amidase [Fodinicurvata sp. EGI_FJ10296]|uniref:amidase n=1 Tax=Fodinicurvata sp. EGI_FJ10296 TaxID=3231908 RepID=UPI003456ADFA